MLFSIDGHLYNFTGTLFENFFQLREMLVRVSRDIKKIKAIKNSVVATIGKHVASSETSEMDFEVSRPDTYTFSGVSYFLLFSSSL